MNGVKLGSTVRALVFGCVSATLTLGVVPARIVLSDVPPLEVIGETGVPMGDQTTDLVASLDAEAVQANAELFGVEGDATSVAISLGQAFAGDGLYAGQARTGDAALVEIAVVEEVVFENGGQGVLVEAHVKTNLAERTFAGLVVPIEASGEWMFVAGPDFLLGMLFVEPTPAALGDDRADCIRKAERDLKRCRRNAAIWFASEIAVCTAALAICESATAGLATPGCVPVWWGCKAVAASAFTVSLGTCELTHRDALEDCAEDHPARPQPRTQVR